LKEQAAGSSDMLIYNCEATMPHVPGGTAVRTSGLLRHFLYNKSKLIHWERLL